MKAVDTRVVTSSEQLEEVAEVYAGVDAFAFDVETVGEYRGDPRRNKVMWLSLATYGRADVIPTGHPHGELVRLEHVLTPAGEDAKAQGLLDKYAEEGKPIPKKYLSKSDAKAHRVWTPAPEQLTRGQVFGALKRVFLGDALKVGHNVKFDLCSVDRYLGGVPPGPYFDTLVAQFLLDHRLRGRLGLGDTVTREFGYTYDKSTGKAVEEHAFSEVAHYSYLDAKYTWLSFLVLERRLETEKLAKLMDLEMDVLAALCTMEQRGTLLDVEQLRALHEDLEKRIDGARGRCYVAAGKDFNLNSVPQKQHLLFGPKEEGGQGLKPRKLTDKQKPSTEASALEPYRKRNKLIAALLDYADLNKLQSTYVTPYLDPKNLVDGRVHTDFVQTGAETGRFSSRRPNMQNIPRPGTELGTKIRGLFIAPPGHRLVVADYSQVEPRIIASFSGDKVMMGTYLDGGDVYQAVADVLGVTRQTGKTLVLSMAYGVGPDTIAERVGISVKEAKELLNTQEAKFRAVGRYKDVVVRECRSRKPPQVKTLLGRRRFIPAIFSNDFSARGHAERQAFNTVIQGSAADIAKLAMVRAHRLLPESCPMILTVHDELVVEAPDDEAQAAVDALHEAMEIPGLLRVPLVADVKIVDRWSEAK